MTKSTLRHTTALRWFLMVSFLFSLSLEAQAIRHVGNGGGEAELRLLQMKAVLPYWMKACHETNCWNGGDLTVQNQDQAKSLRIQFSEQNLPATSDTITLDPRLLYKADEKTPRSDLELASLLIEAVMMKIGVLQPGTLQMNLLPVGTLVQRDGQVMVLSGIDTDVMTGLDDLSDWHSQFLAQTGCRNYRLSEVTSTDWKLRCPNGVIYSTTVDRAATPAKLSIHVDAEASEGIPF